MSNLNKRLKNLLSKSSDEETSSNEETFSDEESTTAYTPKNVIKPAKLTQVNDITKLEQRISSLTTANIQLTDQIKILTERQKKIEDNQKGIHHRIIQIEEFCKNNKK